jgi:Flp pilus assembly secretin CpaC
MWQQMNTRHDIQGPAGRILALVALMLVGGSLLRPARCDAQRSIGVGLKAGETYILPGLSKNGTPEVRFTDNPNCFLLECAGPGKCSVLAAEAGHGSIRATLESGETVVYRISVSAVAHPGQPLQPGAAPHPVGDIFGNRPTTSAGSLVWAPSGVSANPRASTAAAAPASPAGTSVGAPPVGGPAGSGGAAAGRYAQNPAINALEVPPSIAPPGKHYLPVTTIKLTASSSLIFDFPVAISRVAIADTTIADVSVVGPYQLMLVAHKPGATTLSVWQDDGEYFERPVRIEQGGQQQVQLRVVVAELDRSRLEEQGIDISAALSNAGISVFSLQGAVATPYNVQTNLTASGTAGTIVALPPNGVYPPGGQLIPLLLSPTITYGFASTNGQWTTNAMFQILEEHDLAKILAEPVLIAASGEQAKFLSGGEIPIVIAQALNTSIVFKQFGTSVVFVPTVIDNDEIELEFAPEFSQPDYTQGVEMFGFTVPAFVTRRAQTLVRMKENQTLIMAGLVLDNVQSEIRKTPYLGDVPYLGYLFKHTYYHRTKSELVMTVTPQIIRPVPAGIRVALPTDRGPLSPEEVRTQPLNQPDVSRPRFP